MIAQLHAEYLKIKRTPTIWFTIGSALFLPVVMFLVVFFRHNHFIPQENVNPWIDYFKMHFKFIAELFFPFYLTLSAALNLSIEHKSNSWKKLLLLPVSRTSLFLHKGLFLLLQTIFSVLLFFAGMLLFGSLVGIIYPELQLLKYAPEFSTFLLILGRLLIASLAVLSIQYVLSVFFSNTILPITIGTFFTITALIITRSWKYAIYFPYSFSTILNLNSNNKINVEIFLGMTVSEWLSIAISILIMLIGTWLFHKKQWK